MTRPLALLLALFAVAPAAGQRDLRSTEILRYGCGSEFGQREITLFANGTVRLREGPWEAPEIHLDEIGPEALEDNLRVLRGVVTDRELDRVREPLGRGAGGIWIERCEIFLVLPELAEPLRYELSTYDVPPLAISRIIHVAEELANHVRPVTQEERLSDDYEPQFGDVLRTAEGLRFRVLRLTADETGVELEGIDQPLRIFVAVEDMATAFVAIELRENDAWWLRR